MHAEMWREFAPFVEYAALFSLLTFFLSLVIIPLYIKQLPHDFFVHYFTSETYTPFGTGIILTFLRNIFGLLLMVLGFIMLFIPGQGLLTIFLGALCLSFPGKRKVVMRLVANRSIQRSLNWSRTKLGQPPFIWPCS